MISLADIEQARLRLRDAIYESPCPYSRRLSERTGCSLHLKLENLQMTGSFKERGARNRLLQLSAAQGAAGVITASAGNHARGLAFHARELGVEATIVMPVDTPLIKVSATRDEGATVILFGGSYDEAHAEAKRLQQQRGLTFVHPFDDEAVIAGQGTIGLEILEQVPDVEAVVVPIGGGGLCAGVATALRGRGSKAKIYGVEVASLESMAHAVRQGRPEALPARRTIADGIAVRRVAERTLAVVQAEVEALVSVDEEEIAAAILWLLEEEKTVAEGAGAAALAAVMQARLDLQGRRVVVILSGGNIDVNLMSRVIDRGLLRSGRATRLKVLLPDVPGVLAKLLASVAALRANVVTVRHNRFDPEALVGQTAVELLLEVRGFGHIEDVQRALAQAGFEVSRVA